MCADELKLFTRDNGLLVKMQTHTREVRGYYPRLSTRKTGNASEHIRAKEVVNVIHN